MKTRFARLACAAALLALSVSSATAQNYPARQITLVVPFAPGGPADFLGRLIGQKMGEDLGQQVVIDNRPGANTIIGAQAVAKAAPDGYTLLMAIDGTLVMNPFLYSKLAYDPFKDFVPVSLVALVPSAVVGNINIPVSSIKDLVEREKAKPGTFQIGISTPTSQVNVGLLNMMAGTNFTMVPYRGGTTQVTGILAGDIPLGMESINVSLPLWRDNKLKISGTGERAASFAGARNSHDRRDLPRLRSRHLAEHRRARGHAARGGEQAARFNQESVGNARGARQTTRRRHRACEQQLARGVRRLHPLAGGNPCQGHPGSRDKDRLTPLLAAAARLFAIALAVALAHEPTSAQDALDADAKNYPNRTVRIIVPFPPGGPADIVARFIGQKMSEDWGQPVVIENRAGGNTAIGAQAAARASPDGYTLFAPMDTTMVMNPLVIPNLPYDPLKDFAPITLLTKNMSLVVVRSQGPKTIKELIAKAKANPGRLNMGAGTITSRLGALLFARTAGIDVQLVPFKGSAEIGQAVLAGTVDFALDSTGTSLPLIQGGQYRALAKYSNRPLPILPDLPSLGVAAELPGLDESSTWVALVAPAGTAPAIIDKIHREVARIYGDPAMIAKLEKAGILAVGSSSPAEFDAFVRSELERWSKVLKDSGNIRLD